MTIARWDCESRSYNKIKGQCPARMGVIMRLVCPRSLIDDTFPSYIKLSKLATRVLDYCDYLEQWQKGWFAHLHSHHSITGSMPHFLNDTVSSTSQCLN